MMGVQTGAEKSQEEARERWKIHADFTAASFRSLHIAYKGTHGLFLIGI